MTRATFHTIEPRIYVACLAAYNNGYLHGVWIDVGDDAWAIWDAVQTMLAASPIPDAEEYAIHDYEGFEGVRIEECTAFETVVEIASFLGEHGAVGAAVLSYYGNDLAEAREAMDDRYLGRFDSVADYMQEITEETLPIPDALRFYIDWQAMARDAEINGDVLALEIGHQDVHVFAGH